MDSWFPVGCRCKILNKCTHEKTYKRQTLVTILWEVAIQNMGCFVKKFQPMLAVATLGFRLTVSRCFPFNWKALYFCLNRVDPWLTADDQPEELWEQCLPGLSLGIEDTIVHLDLECWPLTHRLSGCRAHTLSFERITRGKYRIMSFLQSPSTPNLQTHIVERISFVQFPNVQNNSFD